MKKMYMSDIRALVIVEFWIYWNVLSCSFFVTIQGKLLTPLPFRIFPQDFHFVVH